MGKIKLVVLMCMLKKRISFMIFTLGVKKGYPDVVTGILQVYSIYVYALLHPGAKLSFVTPLIAWKFDILSDVLKDHFIITTLLGDAVVAKSVYRNYPLKLPIELFMLN